MKNRNKLKSRRRRNYKINSKGIIFAILILSLGIGFSALQSRFRINGTTNVAKVAWDVHLENLVVAEGSVEATVPASISGDSMEVSFDVTLIDTDDFYEFEADIVNGGSMDAKMAKLELSGLSTELKPYIVYKLTYSNGEEIKNKDPLPVGERRRIKVVAKFNQDANIGDVLSGLVGTGELKLNLSFNMSYSQSGTSEPSGPSTGKDSSLIRQLKFEEKALDDSSVDFANLKEKGLYVWHESKDSAYEPVYYYRGNVTNNNVIFADICWKIVRSTESGNIKLVYNGIPSNGECKNSGNSIRIDEGSYNDTKNNAKYVGYMYSDTLTIDSTDAAVNTVNSNIKAIVDDWYKNNLTDYTGMLEDAIWCNDRATLSSGTTIPFAASETRELDSDVPKPEIMDSKICERDIDRFTVSSGNGNGKLEYPVGLLTADEVLVAGNGINGETTYLTNTNPFWTMTPYRFASRSSNVFVVYEDGMLDGATVDEVLDIRPAIVLKSGFVNEGDGSSGAPYVITEIDNNEPIKEQSLIQKLGLDASASSDSSVDFGKVSSTTNGQGLLVKSETMGDDYPIYYYRGNITNNNVIFANKCWKIVRTTETGGTKLIYSGVPSGGKCSSTNVSVGTSAFNGTKNNAKYVGYMFDTTLDVFSTDADANSVNSDIMTSLETWYRDNMTSYTGKLEDAIWCNDRYTTSSGTTIMFAASEERGLDSDAPTPEIRDSRICTRPIDKFTNGYSTGNGKLQYPVGLITADEAMVAGNGINGGNTYLTSTSPFWTMTPSTFASRSANMFVVYEDGMLDGASVDDDSLEVRPSIVLKSGLNVLNGDGSTNNPYIVE